ncbi:alanine--tRNA ligase-related protein [Streptosporangium sp. V21-05]|uniref:alanine--tRNA ligase-related protein n=1 Tax=Streptosporangium sp. V21-05 TaxID=3446115 RepID=UPI003F53A74E
MIFNVGLRICHRTPTTESELLSRPVYHEGDEAYAIWRGVIGLARERIIRRGRKAGFCSMGVPGPRGPCSKPYHDRGLSPPALPSPAVTVRWPARPNHSSRVTAPSPEADAHGWR